MPKLKVPRFSLRKFLFATIVLGSASGYYAQRSQSQFRATQWILNNGGGVYYDYEIDLSKLNQEDIRGNGWTPPPWQIWESPPPGPDWLRETLGIDYLATVVGVDVSDSSFPLSDLAKLKSLPKLEWVCIDLSNSNDCDFSAFSSLSEVRRLEVDFSALKDLSFVKSSRKLQVIKLWDTDVSDIQPISNLTNLERIDINSRLENTTPLAGLTALKSISIDTTDFDIRDFRMLRELEYLQLDVSNCRYSQDQLKEFDSMLPTTQIFVRTNKTPYFESEYDPDAD